MTKLKVGFDELVRLASKQIENIQPVLAIKMVVEGEAIVIDVRDIRELERDGCIPGAYHAPRGLIESWVDPQSEYFKPIFSKTTNFLFCCASGRRSALVVQSLQNMGIENASNMVGGFAAWKLLNGTVSNFNAGEHIDLFDPRDQLVEL